MFGVLFKGLKFECAKSLYLCIDELENPISFPIVYGNFYEACWVCVFYRHLENEIFLSIGVRVGAVAAAVKISLDNDIWSLTTVSGEIGF